MRAIITILHVLLLGSSLALDPVGQFRAGKTIDPADKILKWQADLNGDGHQEVFLSVGSARDEVDIEKENDPGDSAWEFYLSKADGSGYDKPEGVENSPGTISVDELLPINVEECFVGQVEELGKQGIVTASYRSHHPIDGKTAIIYAYTVEGDHLKRSQLAEFDASVENAVFNKYLADGKKTWIALREINGRHKVGNVAVTLENAGEILGSSEGGSEEHEHEFSYGLFCENVSIFRCVDVLVVNDKIYRDVPSGCEISIKAGGRTFVGGKELEGKLTDSTYENREWTKNEMTVDGITYKIQCFLGGDYVSNFRDNPKRKEGDRISMSFGIVTLTTENGNVSLWGKPIGHAKSSVTLNQEARKIFLDGKEVKWPD